MPTKPVPTKIPRRSAFLHDAVKLPLTTKHHRDVDRQIAMSYRGKLHDLFADTDARIATQAWPEE